MVAAVATLAEFSMETILAVTDPVRGMPSTHKWFPSISEIREVCQWHEAKRARLAEAEGRRRRQLLLRDDDRAIAEDRAARPTYDELKAKHGETWGLDAGGQPQAERRQELLELIGRAGRTAFARECERAGVDPRSEFSPSLAKLLAKQLSGHAD